MSDGRTDGDQGSRQRGTEKAAVMGFPSHCVTLPGMTEGTVTPQPPLMLGELLKALKEVTATNPRLGARLLWAMQDCESMAAAPLSSAVHDVVGGFVEANSSELNANARKSLERLGGRAPTKNGSETGKVVVKEYNSQEGSSEQTSDSPDMTSGDFKQTAHEVHQPYRDSDVPVVAAQRSEDSAGAEGKLASNDCDVKPAADKFTETPEASKPASGISKSRSVGNLPTEVLVKRLISGDFSVLRSELPWFPDEGSFRQRLFYLFDDGTRSIAGKFISIFLVLVICLSTVTFVMESMPEFRERPPRCQELLDNGEPLTVKDCEPRPVRAFFYVEAVCIVLFTIDYVVRMCTVHSVPLGKNQSSGLRRTLLYGLEPLNIIDLLAVCPFYVGLAMTNGLGVMRVLRLARTLRLAKIAKHHPGIRMLKDTMVMSGQPLFILLFFNVILVVLFGALIWFAEGQRYSVAHEFLDSHPTGVYVRKDKLHQGDEVSPYRSIPFALWWVSLTMTTVGYGDFSPTTFWGKAVGVACFYVGVIFLALPISVLGSNFEILYNEQIEAQRSLMNRPPEITPQDRFRTMKTNGARKLLTMKFAYLPWLPETDSIRRTIFLIFEDPLSSKLSKATSILVIGTILTSTVASICESIPRLNYVPDTCTPDQLTVENCRPKPDEAFYYVELICIIIFTVDYVLRMVTVHVALPEDFGQPIGTPAMGPLKTTLVYAAQWLNIIDLLAIVPFYVQVAGAESGGASILRVLRLIRVFRVLKMPKMKACAEMFILIVFDALPGLFLLFSMTMMMCVLFAALIVFAEGSNYSVDEFQAEYPMGLYIRPTADGYNVEPSPFRSMLSAFWWFFTTATTVGYGDEYPTTTSGRIVGVACFYTGIVLVAFPITIVGGAFKKFYPAWVSEFGLDASEQAFGSEQAEDADDIPFLGGTEVGEARKPNGEEEGQVRRTAWS